MSPDELSDGEVRLSTGTLFGALDRLVESGLVEAGEEEKVEGRVRRSYTLTHNGHAALAAEAGRMRRAARVVEARVAKAAG
jgi:DNA-binding PadR family transcriptional regulator